MKCLKCGAENHPDQRVCVACGALTPKAGGFYYNQTKTAWRPTREQVLIGGGALILIILIFVLINVFRTVPPDEVAKEWFCAMAERRLGTAQEYVSPNMNAELLSRNSDLRDLSDNYFNEIHNNGAKYEVKPARLSPDGKKANVTVVMSGRDCYRQIRIELIKSGRRWLINSAN